MQKELPVRKNIRLQGYDYSSAGYYFVTICAKNGHEMLGSIDVGTNCVRPCFSEYGYIVDKEIAVLSNTYDTVHVDKYVIMPNHIHMIIVIEADNDGRTQFVPTISRIIKQFKGSITKQIGFSLWQPRFYDEIIRNEEAYRNIWHYIDENPLKWVEDRYNLKETLR
ncbi:MAG: transposase [Oscillospiraceae bacterium]|jgi:REP element-mobilizing transposase RayT|nr:transposase [Oscillospiraceae bacterium]